MLESFVGKIQKSVSLLVLRRPASRHFNEDQLERVTLVPDDVMEGHFAVLAIKGEEIKRFIVELEYLNDPAFLGLLDRAREEYGFRQKGALAVPCRPQELQNILDDRRAKSAKDGGSFGGIMGATCFRFFPPRQSQMYQNPRQKHYPWRRELYECQIS